MVSHRAHREHGAKGKRTESLPENISAYVNIFRQHCLSHSVISVRSSELGERVRNASAGFSLVEITLALLVVGIGMLAILSMFPSGLDQNARSISDTHAAMFAEEVFSALRVQAETNWDGIGQVDIPIAAQSKWDSPVSLDIKLNNTIYTNIYRYPFPGNTNLIDHAFRYRITLTNTVPMIKAATVRFWPGEYGTASNPAMFYAEFFKK